MTSMNISLPDDLKDFVDQQIQAGYSSASEFVRELIRNAQKEAAKEKLQTMLLAGLDSGPSTPLTDSDWHELRKKAEKRGTEPADGRKNK